MKNKIITGIALCSLFITGCSLDKAYLNGPNASTFPATKSEVEAGVFATYKGLTLIDASSTPFPGIQDNASDIGASRINAANYNYQQQSKLPPSNAWVTKVYTQIYKTAARANLVLDGIDNVRELMSEQEYNMYKAELLLVRSFLYDWGCQLYGDIPYIDHTLKLGDTYTRTPKEEVISWILNEDLADEMLDFQEYKYNNAFGTSSVCVLSYPLMRLAELYLIRAEANIEWNGGDLSVAKADIETIRSRAHMPGLSENLSRDGLRSALRYERMVELCNEGFRWFDIRRWDMAESVISGTLYAPALDGSVSNAVPTIDSDWHVTYNGQTFDGKDMNLRRFITMSYDPMKDALWPIPEDERIANPLITQNPGYAGHSIEE